MSLSRCTECETIEGGWELPAGAEDELENLVCSECGNDNCYQGIPEHDDYDMER